MDAIWTHGNRFRARPVAPYDWPRPLFVDMDIRTCPGSRRPRLRSSGEPARFVCPLMSLPSVGSPCVSPCVWKKGCPWRPLLPRPLSSDGFRPIGAVGASLRCWPDLDRNRSSCELSRRGRGPTRSGAATLRERWNLRVSPTGRYRRKGSPFGITAANRGAGWRTGIRFGQIPSSRPTVRRAGPQSAGRRRYRGRP